MRILAQMGSALQATPTTYASHSTLPEQSGVTPSALCQSHEPGRGSAAGQPVAAPAGSPASTADVGRTGVHTVAGATTTYPYSRYTAELGATRSTIHIHRERTASTTTKETP